MINIPKVTSNEADEFGLTQQCNDNAARSQRAAERTHGFAGLVHGKMGEIAKEEDFSGISFESRHLRLHNLNMENRPADSDTPSHSMGLKQDTKNRNLGHWIISGFLAGCSLGLIECIWAFFEGRSHIDAAPLAWMSLASMLASGLAGALVGLAVALVVGNLHHRIPERLQFSASTSIFLVLVALATTVAAIVNHFVYVNLYEWAHDLLTLATLAGAVFLLGTSIKFRPPPMLRIGSLFVILLTAWILPNIVEGRRSILALLFAHTHVASKVLQYWPLDPLPDANKGCEWPAQPITNTNAQYKGHNILLLTIDAFRGDLGGDRLRQSLPRSTTALHKAFRFDFAYAAAPRTTYSAYSMLTGKQAHKLGFVAATTDVNDRFHRLQDDHEILLDPQKWKLLHRYPLGDRSPTLAGMLDQHGYKTTAIIADVCLLAEAGITREFQRVDASPYYKNSRKDLGGISSDFTSEAIIAALDEVRSDPFFIWAHYRDPHHPYTAYAPMKSSESAERRYFSEIRRVDDAIAPVLERLKQNKQFERTIVIITGDHGEEFRDHGGLYHGTTLYNELIHVPLLLYLPQLPGSAISHPISLTDLTPTLVDLLGIDTRAKFHGRSFVPLLTGRPQTQYPIFAYNSSYTRENHQQVSVILDRYKLILDERHQTMELYDLSNDPYERSNLSDERPNIVDSLRCLVSATEVTK